ncbi:MAG: hypothetical protein IJ575_00960 [Selenomonadaceae bacterium]|nr:hypothetical protein [Selenomonadaceae bacterium]
MMQAQKKIEVENFDENYEDDLEITPALEQYLCEVDAGMHLGKIYPDAETMFRDILGDDWRESKK